MLNKIKEQTNSVIIVGTDNTFNEYGVFHMIDNLLPVLCPP